jgi:outer membrane protein W
MKKLLLASTAILAVTAFSNSANAEEFPRWYLGLAGGVADQTSAKFKNSAVTDDFEFDSGYSASAALGYKPASVPNTRVELELSSHSQKIQVAGGGTGGSTKAHAIMANFYYDLADSGVIPYIGLGLGGAQFKLQAPNPSGDSGQNTLAAYQLMTGVAFQFEGLPRTDWLIGYKYLAPFANPEVGAGDTKYEYDNHSVEVGGRFHF